MYSVIVAEDEPWIRGAVVEMIEKAGKQFQVVGEAETGEEAWELIQSTWPLLLITDIRMPDMDGLALIQKIREHQIPMAIIIVSGYDNFQYAQQAISLGVTDYLLKPVEYSQLTTVLDRCKETIAAHKELNECFVRIQAFIEKMFDSDPRTLLRKQHDLVQSILSLKLLNAGACRNLLRLFESRIRQTCDEMGIDSKFQIIRAGHDNDVVLEDFRGLLLQWITEYPHVKSQDTKLIIDQLIKQLNLQYKKDWSLQEMAEYTQLSPSHFGVLFKKQTGMSPVNYINRIRVEQAKERLMQTDKKIYEIAEEVGFSNLPYFTRLFKQVAGLTPKEFRKRLGQ
ncbi:response regulator [Paenibacillus sp. PL2-23]|uniref:response regulator n=1 Tax=Paenibacillus sp. PL2-23 TaxID=2100729 RepID=UPI0030F88727